MMSSSSPDLSQGLKQKIDDQAKSAGPMHFEFAPWMESIKTHIKHSIIGYEALKHK